MSYRIAIIAGEPSGDRLGAAVVRAMPQLSPNIHFVGVGGELMAKAGVELLYSCHDLSVMGLVEVLRHYPRLKRKLQWTVTELQRLKPDLLLTIDYPGFNLRLATAMKRLGVPTLHYVGPQVWAWRAGRLETMKQQVDHIALLFEFELPYYQQAGLAATVVGHPMVGWVHSTLTPAEAKIFCGSSPDRPLIGLFPGSRQSEIARHLPLMVASAEKLWRNQPQRQFVLVAATEPLAREIERWLRQADCRLPLQLVSGHSYDVMRGCELIIAASGTVTLEIALMQVPMVVIYRMAAVSYAILSRLVNIPHVSLCNIVANQAIVPELIQNQANVTRLVATAEPLLRPSAAKEQQQRLATLKSMLAIGERGSENVAQLALSILVSKEK
ncbi:lipid-A-disaccharide synthase [Ectothiorhodospiraceae bacterium BW-2]|nr:lipid-A-disaccharide synthase [Ectothiorhodospiraceae bacterium BW-2]